MLSSELDRTKRALCLAQDRILELTKTQLAMSGTLGQLTEQASTDALTGLSNRRHFMEGLKSTFQDARSRELPFSVVMLDIDSFKSYNDSFGHAEGDKVIWVVAKLLLRNTGGDHIVARYGGEEFAILLRETDAAQAREIAERHRAAIASYPWPARPVSASFGISTLDRTTGDLGTMFEEADRALYHSKSRGRNRVTHHRDINLSSPISPNTATPTDCSETIVFPLHSGSKCDPTTSTDAVAAVTVPVKHPAPSSPSPKENVDRPQIASPAWGVLERFIQSLQGSEASDLRDVLTAIREGIEAEIVFLCNDQNGEVLGAVGDYVPFPEWYHQLTLKLSVELTSGGIWKPSEDRSKGSPTVSPDPSAVIVLPVKSPRSCWLVALRFRDGHFFLPDELRVARVIWQLHVDHRRHDRTHDKLKETLFGIVRCLSSAIDAKDPYTCGHSERVARIAVRLGEEMSLSRGEISDLYLAGLLHDLGKIGIRDAVLCKEGPLTPEEFLHMQEHTVIGEKIIANVTRLAYLRPGIRGHHERFDGKGYPDGLVGAAIPRIARILAVADSCDAMMSARRYRAALSESRIEEIFREGAGTQWDPQIVQHFFECRHELYAVIQRGLGQSVYYAVERAVGAGETINGGPQSIFYDPSRHRAQSRA